MFCVYRCCWRLNWASVELIFFGREWMSSSHREWRSCWHTKTIAFRFIFFSLSKFLGRSKQAFLVLFLRRLIHRSLFVIFFVFPNFVFGWIRLLWLKNLKLSIASLLTMSILQFNFCLFLNSLSVIYPFIISLCFLFLLISFLFFCCSTYVNMSVYSFKKTE